MTHASIDREYSPQLAGGVEYMRIEHQPDVAAEKPEVFQMNGIFVVIVVVVLISAALAIMLTWWEERMEESEAEKLNQHRRHDDEWFI